MSRFTFNISVGHLRLGLRELSFRLIKHRLEGTRIDFEKNLSFSDQCSFLIVLANQIAAHLRLNLRVYVSLERSYPFPL